MEPQHHGWGWNRNTMVCRQQMGPWEHVLPLFVLGYTVLFPTCSDNVLNVPLCGYICTRILYPVTNSVPTYLHLERPRRRGRSKRPGTLFVTGYNMQVHTTNCSQCSQRLTLPTNHSVFFVPTWVYAGTGVPYVPGSQRNMNYHPLAGGQSSQRELRGTMYPHWPSPIH